jgi:hypothetical protein
MIRRLTLVLKALAMLALPLSMLAPTAAGADVIAILASEDTSPYSFLPSLPRYNNPTAYAFRSVDEAAGSFHQFETFLWFDVSAADIPPGHVLTNAQLVVTHSFDATGFGDPVTDPAELSCHEVTGAWDQTTLTWLNKPAFDPPFDRITGITSYGTLACDATLVVFDWIHGTHPNDGFALTNDSARVIGMHTLEADPAIPDSLKANLILTTEVPEPGFATALGIGLVGLAAGSRRRGRMR